MRKFRRAASTFFAVSPEAEGARVPSSLSIHECAKLSPSHQNLPKF
jgi:hypothetical protein